MIDILPLKVLSDEDGPIFGDLNVKLSKLKRLDLEVALGIVVSPPNLKLKTTLAHYDFGSNELIEQSLNLVRRELRSIEVPEILIKEVGKQEKFLVEGEEVKGVKDLWQKLLDIWILQLKAEIWKGGFFPGLTEKLEPLVVIFITKKIEAFGNGYFDPNLDDFVVNIKTGNLHPADLKKVDLLIAEAHKKLLIPFTFEWVLDNKVKLSAIKPYLVNTLVQSASAVTKIDNKTIFSQPESRVKTTVKVFLDLSTGLTIEKEIDGVYIQSEKIYKTDKRDETFDDLAFRLVESASSFLDSPILYKLGDFSEGMGKVRGALRLIHQKSLLEPLIEILKFARVKKELKNIHLVLPFVRSANEFMQLKRELAVRKIMRKNSFKFWLELCTPENLINLDDYIVAGLDGVVLNLDELIAHLNGFDSNQENLSFYKSEIKGLMKFLENKLTLMHKMKVPFIACGSICRNNELLSLLVEKGVFGIIVERYEVGSISVRLHEMEKKLVISRANEKAGHIHL